MEDTSYVSGTKNYVWRERATTLKVAKGWNYIAIHVDEIYDYSYLTVYLRNE
jgi:hypothetical protein